MEITELQESLTATSAEILQLSARNDKLTGKVSRANLQHVAATTVSDVLWFVAVAGERPTKAAKATLSSGEAFAMLSAATIQIY